MYAVTNEYGAVSEILRSLNVFFLNFIPFF